WKSYRAERIPALTTEVRSIGMVIGVTRVLWERWTRRRKCANTRNSPRYGAKSAKPCTPARYANGKKASVFMAGDGYIANGPNVYAESEGFNRLSDAGCVERSGFIGLADWIRGE